MDPKNASDPSSPWYQNADWQPPDGFVYGGYTWQGGQPQKQIGWTYNTDGTMSPNPPSATPPPAATPPPTSGGTPGGGTSGSGAGSPPFQWPTYNPPPFTPQNGVAAPPTYTPTTFSYDDYHLPTLAEAQAQPGFLTGLKNGQDAIQTSAAARGTLRGGGTLKDLFNWTNSASEQNYGNVVNQGENAYSLNRWNAFSNWSTNEANRAAAAGVNFSNAKDVNTSVNNANQSNYNNARQNAADVFNPQFDISKLTFADLYNRWKTQVDSLTNLSRPV